MKSGLVQVRSGISFRSTSPHHTLLRRCAVIYGSWCTCASGTTRRIAGACIDSASTVSKVILGLGWPALCVPVLEVLTAPRLQSPVRAQLLLLLKRWLKLLLLPCRSGSLLDTLLWAPHCPQPAVQVCSVMLGSRSPLRTQSARLHSAPALVHSARGFAPTE